MKSAALARGRLCVSASASAACVQPCREQGRTTALLGTSVPGQWPIVTPVCWTVCLLHWEVSSWWDGVCLCQLLLVAVRYFSIILIYMGNLTRQGLGIHAFLIALQGRHDAQKRGELEQEYVMQKHDVMGVLMHHCTRAEGYLAAVVAELNIFWQNNWHNSILLPFRRITFRQSFMMWPIYVSESLYL